MSIELSNSYQVKDTKTLEDQFSIVRNELFDCFLEGIGEEKSNGTRILAIFGMILAHFYKESLKLAKNDLIEFIGTFLREMEIDEVNIKKFQKIYFKYMIYKTVKDTADRVIKKMGKKERSIQSI